MSQPTAVAQQTTMKTQYWYSIGYTIVLTKYWPLTKIMNRAPSVL